MSTSKPLLKQYDPSLLQKFQRACLHSELNIVQEIIKQEPEIVNTTLPFKQSKAFLLACSSEAGYEKVLPILEALREAGCDIHAKDSWGYNAYCYLKDPKIVHYLAELRLDINTIYPWRGGGVLHYFVDHSYERTNYKEILKALLERGASTTIENHQKMTPIEYAKEQKRTVFISVVSNYLEGKAPKATQDSTHSIDQLQEAKKSSFTSKKAKLIPGY